MRNFSFAKTDQPSMAEFNKRFGGIAEFINNLGNEYVWAKQMVQYVYDSVISVTGNDARVYNQNYDSVFYVGDSFEQVASGNYETWTIKPTSESNAAKLNGKYFIATNSNKVSASDIYFAPENTVWLIWDSSYGYSTNGWLQRYVNPHSELGPVISYVNSSDPNAYPVDDGYTYTFRGKVGAAAQFAHGSYMGTGTYGEGTPNSLTFGFVPALVWIYRSFSLGGTGYNQSEQYNLTFTPSLSGEFVQIYSGKNYDRYRYNYDPSTSTPTTALASVNWENGNKTVKWWSHSSAGYQLNQSDTEYYYLAIG